MSVPTLWVPWEPTQWVGPRAHGPLLGGEMHSREALLGSMCISIPPIPYGMSSPDGPHIEVLCRNLPRKLGELDSRYQSFITWLLLTRVHVFFFRNRPPEELDNKRSSTRRGEFDSSTPEVIGVLLGQVFLA